MIRELVARSFRNSPSILSVGLTGITNVLVGLLVQASVGTVGLGLFALASTPMTVGIAVQRSILSQNVLRGLRVRDVRHLRLCTALVLCGSTIAVAALVLLFHMPAPYWLMCATTPAGLVQDLFRYRCFGLRLGTRAAVSDATWLAGFVGAYLGARTFGVQGITAPVASFSIGLGISLTVAAVWWPHSGLHILDVPPVSRLFVEAAAIFGLGQVAQLVVAAAVAVSVVGVAELAATILSPVGLAASALTAVIVPRLRMERNHVTKASLGVFATCGLVAATCLAASVVGRYWLERLLHVPTGPSLYLTELFYGVGASMGAGVGIYLVYVRVTVQGNKWLTARFVGAASDPLVCIPLSLAIGAPALPVGAIANNSTLLLFAAHWARDVPGPDRPLIKGKRAALSDGQL